MAGIRGKNTKPEMAVRRYLHAKGLRYRLHDTTLPGRPDLVLPKFRTVVFVHGCFWHRHAGCRFAYSPKARADFWLTKLEGNVERDRNTEAMLRGGGWRPLVVWECDLRSERAERVLAKLYKSIVR